MLANLGESSKLFAEPHSMKTGLLFRPVLSAVTIVEHPSVLHDSINTFIRPVSDTNSIKRV